MRPLLLVLLLAAAACSRTAIRADPLPTPSWVERSNVHTRYVLDTLARFEPEASSQMGVEGLDEEIIDLRPGFRERVRQAREEVIAELRRRLAAEQDRRVRQDLEILIHAQDLAQRSSALSEKHFIPSFGLAQLVFSGVRALLDDQIPAERRKAALVRLRKYTGLEPGFTPLSELARADVRAQMQRPGLLYPMRAELERDLNDTRFLVEGAGKLFEQYGITGAEEALAKFREQVAAHDAFVRAELLPQARTDFRLPPEVYAMNLEDLGVELPPEQLVTLARTAFTELQAQMQQLAAVVAKERGWKDADYRAVIRELKKDQLVGEAILPHYQARLGELETIIRREKLVTLPTRPARIRVATEAESAQVPAPHMRPPRLIGNTGEQGEFVLPLNIPSQDPSQQRQFDDFTFAAASWTLTAHEARPGHELQFARLVEDGVSTARMLFAFNSTNVEGWGLYAERIVLPFMPPEGQLISLQHRLLRAARAFCDPELQLGRTTTEEVKRLLMTEVLMSDAMSTQEVERYTFRSPGQATSYFYGFTRLNALRLEVEQALGKDFQALAFHDFLLGQGLLPPELMRAAVLEEFLPAQR